MRPEQFRNFSMRVGEDGNMWYALIGPNLQEGEAGFGETLPEALTNLAELLKTRDLEVLFNRIKVLKQNNRDIELT